MLSKEEVKHIAKLARLGLTEKEIEKYTKDLSNILEHFEKLKEVKVSGVEPMSHSVAAPRDSEARREKRTKFSATLLENILRVDKEASGFKLHGSRLLELAPETKNDYLKTKSILK